jgi:hypothetical protein
LGEAVAFLSLIVRPLHSCRSRKASMWPQRNAILPIE